MRLTDPLFSIVAVGLILLASAAAIPVLAHETCYGLSAVLHSCK